MVSMFSGIFACLATLVSSITMAQARASKGKTGASVPLTAVLTSNCELELELIQTQMAQKPMLRAEVGMRVRCANKASAE